MTSGELLLRRNKTRRRPNTRRLRPRFLPPPPALPCLPSQFAGVTIRRELTSSRPPGHRQRQVRRQLRPRVQILCPGQTRGLSHYTAPGLEDTEPHRRVQYV